jgi:quinoprotein glucose dehydrogenase
MRRVFIFVLVIIFVSTLTPEAQTVPVGEWYAYGADGANNKYSPLDQITVANFTDLEIAWRWSSISTEVTEERANINAGLFKATPLMVGGLVYVSTALGQVAALSAGTGEPAWTYDPRSYERLEKPANIEWQHRGVSYWRDTERDDARIFIATHDQRLIAFDAETGVPSTGFGENGIVDLSGSLGRPTDRARLTHSSPVAIVRNTVIVGSSLTDQTTTREHRLAMCGRLMPAPAR